MDWENIFETALTALIGGGLGGVLGWRMKKRKDKAEVDKAEEEVKESQIDNIRKTMDEVYKPIIEDLKRAIADAREDAQKACERVNELEDKVDRLEREKRELKRENTMLKDILHEINPELVESKRREYAQRQASGQPRSKTGQFVKKKGSNENPSR